VGLKYLWRTTLQRACICALRGILACLQSGKRILRSISLLGDLIAFGLKSAIPQRQLAK
jgi:hypothetical protein